MWGYQKDDAHLIDYDLRVVDGLEEFGHAFRGPVPVRRDGFLACLGAAQTFGRFCADPYPKLLREALGVETLNLGVGGAGASFFKRPDIQAVLAGARLCIVQVLSGRSQATDRFSTDGNMYGVRASDGLRMSAEEFFEDLLSNSSRSEIETVIQEFRSAYVSEMIGLLEALACPTILLWFSTRQTDYDADYSSVHRLLGEFPQLVDQKTISQIAPFATRYVECVTSTGLPHPIRDMNGREASFVLDYRVQRRTQHTKHENTYYPSPEMHREVAEQLAPVCRELLDQQGLA